MNYQEFSTKIKTKYPQYADMDDRELAQKMVQKYPQYSDVSLDEPKRGFMGKAWDALGKPEQLSRQGLQQLAQFIPEGKVTGNLPADLARGTPKILANTMAQAAPGFVSRGALVTTGAMPLARGLGAAAKVIGPGIGRQLESLSGMKPGLLGQAFKDPSLYFARIPEEARQAYKAAQPFIRESKMITGTPNPMALAQKALKAYETGTLQPEEALEARKVIDQLWDTKRVTKGWADSARLKLDSVAKLRGSLEKADTAFSRGSKATALRQLFPQNKYGGTSAFKTAIMAGLQAMGPAGKVVTAAMSPAAVGLGATTLGAGAKVASPFVNNPRLALSVQQLIDALTRSQNQSANPGTGQ